MITAGQPAAAGEIACGQRPACLGRAGRWQPPAKLGWAIDYSGAFASGRFKAGGADAIVLPLGEVEKAEAAARARGAMSPVEALVCRQKKHLVCYTNCGAYEPGHWNEGKLAAAPEVLGKTMAGYERERWLDIRRLDVLGPLIGEKFASAARLGCEAIVCDNTEAWVTGTDGRDGEALARFRADGVEGVSALAETRVEATTGFAISYADQLAFNRMIAGQAHAACLSAGLINDVFQIDDLAEAFDFALNEQCHHCGWCDLYRPFIRAGKPVLHLEFADNEGFCGPGAAPMPRICRDVRKAGLSTFNTVKRLASSKLDAADRPQLCPKR